MSFYGNVVNGAQTAFVFDKVYSSRSEMDLSAKYDSILVGRFVLVKYDELNTKCKIGYLSSEGLLYAQDLGGMGTVVDESTRYGVPGGITLNVKDIIRVPGKMTSQEGVVSIHNYSNPTTPIDVYFIYEGILEDEEGNQKPRFTKLDESYDSKIQNYLTNYQLDIEKYGEACGRGYDATVWQKVYTTEEMYIQVASLNTEIPTFHVHQDAPTLSPVAPHFTRTANEAFYTLHTQPQWGFRLKAADGRLQGQYVSQDGTMGDRKIQLSEDGTVYPSDETTVWYNNVYKPSSGEINNYVYHIADADAENDTSGWKLIQNKNGGEVALTPIDAAVYFNRDGFDSDYSNHSEGWKDSITVAPTGFSGHTYEGHVVKEGESDPRVAVDTQELSILLPSIGNAIADVWDVMYSAGVNNTNKRNKMIEWKDPQIAGEGNEEGLRLIGRIDEGYGYHYDTDAVQTVAGMINSVHDLMGMIVAKGVPEEELQVWSQDQDDFDTISEKYQIARDAYLAIKDSENEMDILRASDLLQKSNKWAQMIIDTFNIVDGFEVDDETGFIFFSNNVLENNSAKLFNEDPSLEVIPALKDANENYIYYDKKTGLYYYKHTTYDYVEDITGPDDIKDDYTLVELDDWDNNSKNYYRVDFGTNHPEYILSKQYVDKAQYVENVSVKPNQRSLTIGAAYEPGKFYVREECVNEITKGRYYKYKLAMGDYDANAEYYELLGDIEPLGEESNLYFPGTYYRAAYELAVDESEISLQGGDFDETAFLRMVYDATTNPNGVRLYIMGEINKDSYYNMIEVKEWKDVQYGHSLYKLESLVLSETLEFEEGYDYYQAEHSKSEDGSSAITSYYIINESYEPMPESGWEYVPGVFYKYDDNEKRYKRDDDKFDKFDTYYKKVVSLTLVTNDNTVNLNTAKQIKNLVNLPLDTDSSITVSDNIATNVFYYKDGKDYKQINLQTYFGDDYVKKEDAQLYVLKMRKLIGGYKPNTFYYQVGSENPDYEGSWVVDTKSVYTPGRHYYTYNQLQIGNIVENYAAYMPGTYYFNDEDGLWRLDDSLDFTPGREYYKPNFIYVIQDLTNHYPKYGVWNTAVKEIPEHVTLAHRSERFEMKPLYGLGKNMNTLFGLILRMNYLLEDGNVMTRDTKTVQGCINTLNDIIAKFSHLIPGEIVIVDDHGRIHSSPYTTTQPFFTTNIQKSHPEDNAMETAEDRFVLLDIDTRADHPGITIKHIYNPVDDTTTASDKNADRDDKSYTPGDGNNAVTTENQDTLELYTPIVDNMGHVVGKNTETVTLPYGVKEFRTVGLTTEESVDDIYTTITNVESGNNTDSKTFTPTGAGDGDYQYMIATNTQDLLSINPANKWVQVKIDDEKKEVTLAHEVHSVDTIAQYSNYNKEDGDTRREDPEDNIVIQDIAFDKAGHVIQNREHTYTLPYGYKTYETNGLDIATADLYTTATPDDGTADTKTTGDATNTTVANKTQDTLALNTANKWIQVQIEDDEVNFAHEVHGVNVQKVDDTDLNDGADTITLQDMAFDAAGHIIENRPHTYTLPYGFKFIATNGRSAEDTAINTQNNVVTNTVAAEVTQDTLTINSGNKWIRIDTDESADSLTFSHDVHAIETANKAASDINGNGDTITIPDLIFDAAGHVTAHQLHTYTLPYGFKVIRVTNNSGVEAPTSAVATNGQIADNTQDTLTFSATNKWITLDNVTEDTVKLGHIRSTLAAGTHELNVQTPKFGAAFNLQTFATDEAGHVTAKGTETVTIPGLSLDAQEESDNETSVITAVDLTAADGAFTYRSKNFEEVKITDLTDTTTEGGPSKAELHVVLSNMQAEYSDLVSAEATTRESADTNIIDNVIPAAIDEAIGHIEYAPEVLEQSHYALVGAVKTRPATQEDVDTGLAENLNDPIVIQREATEEDVLAYEYVGKGAIVIGQMIDDQDVEKVIDVHHADAIIKNLQETVTLLIERIEALEAKVQ